MDSRLSPEKIQAAFKRALAQAGLLAEEDTAVIFYDLHFLEERVRDLIERFPASALHAVAIKANPLHQILKKLNALGVGAEAATLPELHLALQAGFPPAKIVFDSPAKTMAELAFALRTGVHINADSFADLDRIESLSQTIDFPGTLGVRINPQVGAGKILSTSVAGEYSKFGIPLITYRTQLIDRFKRHAWLQGIHVHIGSQGIALEMLLRGLADSMAFVEEVQQQTGRAIQIIDIGGGLPVTYDPQHPAPGMARYCDAIKQQFPALFAGQYRLITEFGRSIHANAGWVVSKVEQVKRDPGLNTAMIHVGADLFLRECYNPADWHHDIFVLAPDGSRKTEPDPNPYMIAGPLCFAGDLIAREIQLPRIAAGDYLVIQDTGAYTLSMWSRYNSRQLPKVIGYAEDGQHFEILKARETIADILDFWA